MLQWAVDQNEEFGLCMVSAPGVDAETLRIKFSTRVNPLAAKQVKLLNEAGDPRTLQGAPATGSIEVDEGPVVIVEAGTRPFPSAATKTDAAAANLDDEGAFKLNVTLLTSVTDCLCNELPPVVHYGRGILTVAVLCEPSDSERRDPKMSDWMSGALSTPISEVWSANSNGTDDDTTNP